MSISAIGRAGALGPTTGPSATPQVADGSFADSLAKAIQSVDTKTAEANAAVSGMLSGTTDVHEAMLALHEAEESLEITVAIRNKFVQAYQDIMKMGL